MFLAVIPGKWDIHSNEYCWWKCHRVRNSNMRVPPSMIKLSCAKLGFKTRWVSLVKLSLHFFPPKTFNFHDLMYLEITERLSQAKGIILSLVYADFLKLMRCSCLDSVLRPVLLSTLLYLYHQQRGAKSSFTSAFNSYLSLQSTFRKFVSQDTKVAPSERYR